MSRTPSTMSLPHPEKHMKDIEKPTSDEANTPSATSSTADPYLVSLDSSEDPLTVPNSKKWLTVIIISASSLCVTNLSSIAAFTETGVEREFNVSHIVSILSISLFVLGLGVGPLFVGPLSEVYGRNIVYQVSFFLLFAFSWPVTFAPDIAVYLIFRFLTGLSGAAFLSVAGGTVSDLFVGNKVANPMALYTLSPFIGPVLGPLLGGFINQHLYWRWTYRITLVWVFAQLVAIFLFVPETYTPVLLKQKAARLRTTTGDPKYYAPLDRRDNSLLASIAVSCYKPFELLLFDRMALLLDIWTSLVLGILYLTFQAFPIIFGQVHGFNAEMTGLTFLGIGVGMIIGAATQPMWNRYAASQCQCQCPAPKPSLTLITPSSSTLAPSVTSIHAPPRYFALQHQKHSGSPPPETRLAMGMVGAILTPLGLFFLAFTTYPQVHYIVPIIASVPFGTGVYFVFTSVFTYLVLAYRPIAASAMAANTALRCAFAAAFPLFAPVMYERLGTVGATALLAGLTTVMAPLPFVFSHIGARLRAKSRFAVC